MTKELNIKVTKCILVITEQELLSLLGKDPDLWRTAIKRGKARLRGDNARQRVEDRKEN